MIELKARIPLQKNGPPVQITLSQFDTIFRFVFTITLDGEIWSLPPEAYIIMNGLKQDGTIFSYLGEVVDGRAVINTGAQMTSAPGYVRCVIVVLDFKAHTLGSTSNFILDLIPVPRAREHHRTELPVDLSIENIFDGGE